MKNLVGNFFIHSNRRVLGQLIVPPRLKELLLHRDAAIQVNPEQDLCESVAHSFRFGNQLELARRDPVNGLLPLVSHVEGLGEILTASSEAQDQVSLNLRAVLADVVDRDL